jgi:hypothetical protein
MKINFDIDAVTFTEFGIGRDEAGNQAFAAVPVDVEVQGTLREMAQETLTALEKEDGPSRYEPSEKHGAMEYLYVSLKDKLADTFRQLHEAAQLEIDTSGLTNPADVFCYFARFTDGKKRRLTALRRATQFKGVLKSKGRLVRMWDDTLRLLEDDVFRLDHDFDLLIDSAHVHILRPSGFEFAGRLQDAILQAVPENMEAIKKDISFVQFDAIEAYTAKHPRAARYLASIRGAATKNINKSALRKLCSTTGVEVTESKGMIVVSAGHEIAFLEVLDRRRYRLELVKGSAERYRARSRQMLRD